MKLVFALIAAVGFIVANNHGGDKLLAGEGSGTGPLKLAGHRTGPDTKLI